MNRKTVTELGTKADPMVDKILVDNEPIRRKEKPVHVLLNKPKGYISAVSDPGTRPVVVDLLKKVKGRVYPVGRLDYDAEGVLLITNDGELSNRLIHPNFKIKKTYEVKVRGVPTDKTLSKLKSGVYLEDGRTQPAEVRFLRKAKENSWIEITVTEGRNRLIKRMCKRVGHPVMKLKRTEFAGIRLGRLDVGEYRFLKPQEVRALKDLSRG